MAPVTNASVIFNDVPQGFPEPGKTVIYDESNKIDIESISLEGGFLVKTLYLSVDPYMRGRMRGPETKSYSAPFVLGKPIDGFGVAVVIRSESSDVKVGDHVYGMLSYQNYDIHKGLKSSHLIVIENKEKLPWSYYVGVLGMAGATAYMGWKEYSNAKKGETALVSAGAGPVGSFVIQLAKRDGLKVIASAGSKEKVEFLKNIGADVAFNYKTTDTNKVLEEHGPVDVYWDNVGGDTLEAALANANINARFIECGMISGYNGNASPIKNIMQVVSRSISMYGFIVSRLYPKYLKEFYETVPGIVANGEIKYNEEIFEGLQSAGDVLLAVQKGANKGKAVIHVADA